MSSITLKERVEALEREVKFLKKRQGRSKRVGELPWWVRLAGTFENDPVFDRIAEEGKLYRESLRQRKRRRKE
jgi:hypothetical protein